MKFSSLKQGIGLIFTCLFIAAPNPVWSNKDLNQADIIAGYGSGNNPTGTDVGEIFFSLEDTMLFITYQTSATEEHDWILFTTHLYLDTISPRSRGEPGQYPYNSDEINSTSYTFPISINELSSRFGISWNTMVYIMSHCDVYHDLNDNSRYDRNEPIECGFGCRPPDAWIGGQPWFAYLWFLLSPPSGNNETDIDFHAVSNLSIYPSIIKPKSQVLIRYQVPTTRHSSLKVYNSTGELVEQIEGGNTKDIFHFNTGNLNSGLYFLKVRAGNYQATGKILIL